MAKDKVTVLGAGYVGLTTATLLANSGYRVFLVEPNKDRLKKIQAGKPFFYEAGLDPLVKEAIKQGSLVPTSSYKESVPKSRFIFSCVGTPDNPDGSSNLSYVFSAAQEASRYVSPRSIYIQKSTVPVGTGQRVKKVFARGKQVSYVSNPEFLREGTALQDSINFDRIVVGGDDKKAVTSVIGLYKSIAQSRDQIAKLAGIETTTHLGRYISTNLDSAELIKVTANAFLALKISFANSIAKLADHTGADINEVMYAVGADKRIGQAFLSAGRGYGGGCFPKDVSGLISSAVDHGVDMAIMAAAQDVNDSMPGYIANKAKQELGGLKEKKLAVLGLAFKAGTSDARRSPGVKLANILSKSGAHVTVFDPKANGEAKEDLRKAVVIKDTAEEAVKGSSAVLIATDWPEFEALDWPKLARSMNGDLFVDCMNSFNKQSLIKSGFRYLGVGRN